MLPLRDAFRISELSRVAVVGAGGKTSAMFRIARQFHFSIITTSTHLLGGQGSLADKHLVLNDAEAIDLAKIQIRSGVLLVTGALDKEKYRFLAPTEAQLARILGIAEEWKVPLFIEADGARHRSIKAPGEHEPAIPSFANNIVLVAGLSVFGKPLTEDIVHRPSVFAELGGIEVGDPISPESFQKVLNHPLGGLKNIPNNAERNILLTQPNDGATLKTGKKIADSVNSDWDNIAIADTKDPSGEVIYLRRRVAGIVLAAGGSVRYGKQKIYEEFHGVTFLRRVCETALSVLDEVVVVLRAGDKRGEEELNGLAARAVYNQEPDLGQSGSIKVGLQHISDRTGGVIFLHADQPQTNSLLLKALLDEGAKTNAAIVAPYIDGRRGTPVYFDKRTFQDLMLVEGDQGGKQIFHKYAPRYVTWLDKKQLIDVDTSSDLDRLLDA